MGGVGPIGIRAGRGQYSDVSAEWLQKFAVGSLGDRMNKIWSYILLLNNWIGSANPKWLQADIKQECSRVRQVARLACTGLYVTV